MKKLHKFRKFNAMVLDTKKQKFIKGGGNGNGNGNGGNNGGNGGGGNGNGGSGGGCPPPSF